MLTGAYSSSNALAMVQTADDLGVPFLVCTAADDRITQHRRKNIFRLNPPASEYTRGMEQLLGHELKPKTMAIVYENSPFGTSAAIRMMWFCREKEIEIADIIPYHKERATVEYFDRIIAPLVRHQPEAIFMTSYFKDGVLLVKQIRAVGLTSRLLGGAGGFTHPKFIEAAGDAARSMLTATLWSTNWQGITWTCIAANTDKPRTIMARRLTPPCWWWPMPCAGPVQRYPMIFATP